MKKVFIILLLVFTFWAGGIYYTPPLKADAENHYYTTQVEHLFFHCLIAYPEIAFAKSNPMQKSYLRDCITPLEFTRVLNSLYDNNYILVSIYDTFYVKNGISYKNKLKLPIGKKALIISFDDVNYDHKKMGYGMVDKLIIDNDGNIASSTTLNGKEEISYTNEFVPIVENFVKQHPDFSLNGARGTICLTGYDGIFGYRTSHTNTSRFKDTEISNATIIAQRLKDMGWNFACHSYGHYHMKQISNEKFKNEIQNWQNEVEKIIGKTSVYVYPYGEWEVFENNDYSAKHKMLIDAGFGLFCGVGMKTFYSYLPNSFGKKVLFMDRKAVDGTTLNSNSPYLAPFFNPIKVLDERRPDF